MVILTLGTTLVKLGYYLSEASELQLWTFLTSFVTLGACHYVINQCAQLVHLCQFGDCTLGTTLVALRYYLSSPQVLPQQPLGTTLINLRYYLNRPYVLAQLKLGSTHLKSWNFIRDPQSMPLCDYLVCSIGSPFLFWGLYLRNCLNNPQVPS